MPDDIPNDYQEILHQIHAEMFLRRLKHHLDPASEITMNENIVSDLNDLDLRLLVQDESPSTDSEVIQKFLEDDEFRDNLLMATRTLMKSQSKET
ncbi:hypothetical protein [Gimesia chilikensis]|uniref:Uncharacterized protein n=1 Tax=Gimesia chilikensis TaxID=2605989 RepID=A0A517PYH6_9PLAN|nr:hypothetical protein [Gimesia chilikensis]QDT24435.1 hypothetical protein HG66A1_62670 [Gimesia chilikensis]